MNSKTIVNSSYRPYEFKPGQTYFIVSAEPGIYMTVQSGINLYYYANDHKFRRLIDDASIDPNIKITSMSSFTIPHLPADGNLPLADFMKAFVEQHDADKQS